MQSEFAGDFEALVATRAEDPSASTMCASFAAALAGIVEDARAGVDVTHYLMLGRIWAGGQRWQARVSKRSLAVAATSGGTFLPESGDVDVRRVASSVLAAARNTHDNPLAPTPEVRSAVAAILAARHAAMLEDALGPAWFVHRQSAATAIAWTGSIALCVAQDSTDAEFVTLMQRFAKTIKKPRGTDAVADYLASPPDFLAFQPGTAADVWSCIATACMRASRTLEEAAHRGERVPRRTVRDRKRRGTPKPPEGTWSRTEAGRMLAEDTTTLKRLEKLGIVAPTLVGRSVRYSRVDLLAAKEALARRRG